MPTNISNAVGTARQFTPQPDSTYQGRYAGVNATNAASPSAGNFDMLANNLVKLDSALQGYAVGHEKYMMETGIAQATNMVNGMTPAAIQRLNMIDAAQRFGFADSVDNPYFKAYADKLRGEFMSNKMKQEYDAKYAMTPAKSADEEQSRFADFSADWKDNNLQGSSTPMNPYAFDMGYNGTNLMNCNNLANAFWKKKNEDDVQVVITSTQGKLGQLIENSVDLLKNNGAMTDAAQAVFNEPRLMGLPIAYRKKMLDEWATELVQTGHLDAKRLKQMCQRLVIQTDENGEPVYAADLMDMQTYATAAQRFNSQFMTKWKQDEINKIIKTKDRNTYFKQLEYLRQNDPDKAPEYASLYSAIDAGIKHKEAEEKQVRLAKQKAMLAKQKTNDKTSQEAETLQGFMEVAMGGGDTYKNLPLSTYKFKNEDLYPRVLKDLDYYILGDNGDSKMEYITRLLSIPQVKALRDSISSNITFAMDNIVPTSDGSPVCSDKAKEIMQFYAYNPNSCEHLFGAEVGRRAKILKNLVDMNGQDFDAGLQQFAVYNAADRDAKEDYKKQVSDMIVSTNYTAEGVPHLGGGLDSVKVWGNPDMESAITDLATVLCCQGFDPQSALNQAGSTIQNSFYTYHWGAFPKGLMNDIGTPDDEGYFQQSLDDAMASVSGDGNNYDDVVVRYDRASQTFYFTDSSQGTSGSKSLSYIRKAAKEFYARDSKWAEDNAQSSDYEKSVEDINAERGALPQNDEAAEAVSDIPNLAY